MQYILYLRCGQCRYLLCMQVTSAPQLAVTKVEMAVMLVSVQVTHTSHTHTGHTHTQVTHTQVTHTQVTHTSHTHTGHTHTVHIQPARECGWPSDHINLAFLVDSTLQLGSHLCVAWCVNICQWRKCRQESIHDCSVGHFIYSQTLLRFLPVFVHPHSTIMLCLEVEVAIMCSLYSTATTTLWCDILSNCQSTKHEGLLLMLFCTLW